MNDVFLFSEDEPEEEVLNTAPPYEILIVDDDEEIHTITKMALADFKLDGRPVKFHSGYSGEEAKQFLSNNTAIAMTSKYCRPPVVL